MLTTPKHDISNKEVVKEKVIKPATDVFLENTIVDIDEITLETPTITLFGKKLDKLVIALHTSGIIILTLMFMTLGLFSLPGRKQKTMIILYITAVAFFIEEMIYTKPSIAETQLELNILGFVSNHLHALIGPVIMLLVASKFLPIYYNPKLIYVLLGASLLIVITSLSFSSDHTATSYRAIRIYKQVLYNLTVVLLLIFIVLCRPLPSLSGVPMYNSSPVSIPKVNPPTIPKSLPKSLPTIPKSFPKSFPTIPKSLPTIPKSFPKSLPTIPKSLPNAPAPSVIKTGPMTVDEFWSSYSK